MPEGGVSAVEAAERAATATLTGCGVAEVGIRHVVAVLPHTSRKREKLIAKYAEKRRELRKRLNDATVSIDDKLEIQQKFAKLPRNSCPTRLNRRCRISGRSRSYYRKFGISRIALRDLALKGHLPGVRKSSW